jgi:hypothetical protein
LERNNKIFGFALLLPVLLWVFIILSYSVNVPWFDDFDPFPDFLRSWIDAGSIEEKLTLLFHPNNEHRMVIGKLIALLYFKLTGTLNITFIHIAGGCFTLGTLALIWSAFKKQNFSIWYFLPVPFLLFQFQYHLVFLWAICSMQHQTVVFFVILSMFLLSRRHFLWSILAAICATYAMSSGIFVWVSGAVILILGSRYRQLGIWVLTGAIAIGLYFTGMSPQGNEESFVFLAKYPHLSVLGFFAFLGGLFDMLPEKSITTRSVLPVLMGIITMIWVALWLFATSVPWLKQTLGITLKRPAFINTADGGSAEKKSFQEFLLGIMIFLLANALVIGLLRPRFGFFVMIVSNYKLYPALFLIVTYLSFISSTGAVVQNKIFRLATVVSVVIWVISIYTYLPIITERKKFLLANAYNQQHNGYGLGHVPFSSSAMYVDTLMKRMVDEGIYHYPEQSEWLATEILKIGEPLAGGSGISYKIDKNAILVEDNEAPISWDSDTGQYAFLKRGSKIYIFKLVQRTYTGRNLLKQYDKGSFVEIPFAAAEPGDYQLGIIRVVNNVVSGGIMENIVVP